MTTMQWWQDGGQDRPLVAGQVYDLPEAVALALLRGGVAAMTPPTIQSPQPRLERKRRGAVVHV